MSIIVAEHLMKKYGSTVAVSDVSFSVAQGEIFGLLGPNGAGKSTTIRMLTTLSRPDAGTAYVAGQDVSRRSKTAREAIGYVAQSAGTDLYLTGRENLLVQAAIHRMGRQESRRRASELLELVGLSRAADKPVRTYSGGMQRRLEIALGIVHNPRVLFLDEPTTGLDPEARSIMWRELSRLKEELDLTILLTTHYLEEADQLADNIAIINNGTMVAHGTPEELKSSLMSDFVRIEFASTIAASEATRVLAASGAREVRADGQMLGAQMDDGSRSLVLLLTRLSEAGLHAESVSVSRPTLDDVYLRHTAGAFTANNAGSADVGSEVTVWPT